MKILIVTQYFWPENFRINDLALGLIERGHQVTVLTGIPNYPGGKYFEGYGLWGPYRENYGQVKVIRIPIIPRGKKKGFQLATNYLSFALIGSLLFPFFCRGKFDRIFIYEVSPVTVAFPAIVLKYLKKIPVFFWVTDLWPESLVAANMVNSPFILNLINRMVQFIYKHCDYILVASRGFIEKIAKQKTPIKKIVFWPQWAESIFAQREFKREELPIKELPQGFIVMFAGNIGTAQSFETIIEAAEKLKSYSDLHWVILGDGIMQEWVEKQVKERGLSNCFHLLGSKPLIEVPKYYFVADVLLVSLKKDPLFSITIPGKLQAYLASGKPILASLDGEGAQIIKDSKSGEVCKAGDANELADVVVKMYNLPKEERELMGRNAITYFNENFERENLLTRLEKLMQ